MTKIWFLTLILPFSLSPLSIPPTFFFIKSKRWRDSKLHLFPFLLVIESNKEWAAAQEFIEYRFLWAREGGNISGDKKMKKENGTFIIRSKRKYVINSWRIQHTVFIRDFIVEHINNQEQFFLWYLIGYLRERYNLSSDHMNLTESCIQFFLS